MTKRVKLPNLYQYPICGATSTHMDTHIHAVGKCEMVVPFILVVLA